MILWYRNLFPKPCGPACTRSVRGIGGGLRRLATAVVTGLLLTGCTTPPAEYHDVVQHPYALRETAVTLDLSARGPGDISQMVAQFGAERPNNGSRFVVTADADSARRIQAALRSAGVRNADMQIVAAAQPMTVVRRDVAATVPGCIGAPRSMLGFTTLDDGYGHDNANSALLGCAVRRNIAAMVDDPRTLGVAEPASAHDGARAAEVYGHWVKGEPTESRSVLPSARTATTGVESGGK
jgi:type IV pilus biogenesis protein CpaD/CtpE